MMLRKYIRYRSVIIISFWQSLIKIPAVFGALAILVLLFTYINDYLIIGIVTLSLIVIIQRKYFVLFAIILLLVLLRINHLNQQSLTVGMSDHVSNTSLALADGVMKEYTQEVLLKMPESDLWFLGEFPKYPAISAGQWLQIEGQVRPQTARTEFDYELYLRSKNIYGVISINQMRVVGEDHLLTLGSLVRKQIDSIVKKSMLQPESSLFTGLLIGGNQGFDTALEESMVRTGTTHLVAVSGSNFAMFTMLIVNLAGVINRRWVMLISIVISILFLLVVGITNIPALRACIMIIIWAWGKFTGRRVHVLITLLLTLSLFLLFNPWSIFDVSLQLSLMALIGILFFFPSLKFIFPKGILGEIIAGTIAATISTSIVSISSFGGVSLIGVLANIILIPLLSIASICELGVVFISVFFKELGVILFTISANGLTFIIQIIAWLSSISFAYVNQPVIGIAYISILIAVMVYADYLLLHQKYKRIWADNVASPNNLH